VVGGGDGACAAVGAGAIRPGVAYASLGSSSWIGLCSDRPLLDPDMRTFTWAHLIDGAFAPTGTMQTAGLSQTWAEGLIADAGALDTLAEHAPPGAAGLVFLPYLLGERSPHWNPNARGAFVGLTLRHGPAHLARAVLEGVALNLRTILDCFDGVDGTVERVRLTGGGARSALSAQILADVLEVETVVPDAAESVSGLGAAVAAGVGVGLYDGWDAVDAWRRPERAFKPDPQRAARYRVLHGVFTDAYESLETTFGRLSALEKERSDGSD
jgi:xylulokinase